MTKRSSFCRRPGVALLFVLWVLAALVVVALSLANLGRGRWTRYRLMEMQVLQGQATLSVFAIAQSVLAEDTPDLDLPDEAWASDDPARFVRHLQGRELILFTANDQRTRLGLEDESGRLNAHTATAAMLARLPGMTLAWAEALVSLREDLRQFQSQAPRNLNAPLPGLSGPITSHAELLRLLMAALKESGASITPEPATLARHTGPWDQPPGAEPAANAVMRYLTLYSRAPNVDSRGKARVNINTAEAATLSQAVGWIFTADQVAGIVRVRVGQPFASVGELLLRDLPVNTPQGIRLIRIEKSQLLQVADKLTVNDAALLTGLVNVNTASREVLACLPGLDESAVQAILLRRTQEERQSLASPGWLLEVLSSEQFAQVSNYVTVRSWQFRVQWAWPHQQETLLPAATYGNAVMERNQGRVGILESMSYRAPWVDPRQ